MTIAVPSERIETDIDLRLREAAKTIRLNGFRQGKVPFKVVKKRLGKGVRGEVIGEVMSQSFYDAVSQENLKPAGQPKIEPIDTDEGKDLKFIAIFEVYPDVELPDLKNIIIDKPAADVADQDIIFKGDDGGSGITALTLDMSAAGAATFNAGATFGGNLTTSGNLLINAANT